MKIISVSQSNNSQSFTKKPTQQNCKNPLPTNRSSVTKTHNGSNKTHKETKTHNECDGRKQSEKHSKLVCTKCNEDFVNLQQLRTHNRNHHAFECEYCTRGIIKSFETQKGLWSHQRNQHARIFPYKCTVCPRAFKQHETLRGHTQNKHASGHDVKCDFCSKMLMSIFEKDNHIKKCHSNRRYYCLQ